MVALTVWVARSSIAGQQHARSSAMAMIQWEVSWLSFGYGKSDMVCVSGLAVLTVITERRFSALEYDICHGLAFGRTTISHLNSKPV